MRDSQGIANQSPLVALEYLKVEPSCTNDGANLRSTVFLCLFGFLQYFEKCEIMARFLYSRGALGRGLDK